MAVKSSKNTMAASHFRASLVRWVEESGKKKNELAAELGLSPSNFGDYLHGVKSPSLAVMEEIATAIGLDLVDMLQEGRVILEGTERLPAAPPATAQPPALDKDEKIELLEKISRLTDKLLASDDERSKLAARRDYLDDQFHAADNRIKEKDKIISTTTEALRLKDIEIAEKREQLMAKDKIIQHLVGLLKGANLEHIIPPTLISLIQTSREKSLER